MSKYLIERLFVLMVFLSVGILFVEPAQASQWKLSHEVEISNTRKLCVYINKESGHTKSVEQSKNQYCRTYL